MTILSIRTDQPQAELALLNENDTIASLSWQAHRQLAETIHQKIMELLEDNNIGLKDLQAIAVYKGPGSFTGLRIGFSVANSMSDSLQIPIVSAGGPDWQNQAVQSLADGQNEIIGVPDYGSEPKTTKQKK